MERGFYLIFASLVLLAVLTAPFLPSPGGDVDLEGYTRVEDIRAEGNFLVFETGCYRLRMVVSESQAAAVERGLLDVETSRPLTHDLFASVLSELDAEPVAVKIHSLKEGSFRAYLVLREDGSILKIDSRPSDATALATRTGTPVYLKQEVLREAGTDTCERGGKTL
ncbi:MAG: bifunctional nuclease family protein [Candidatus Nanohaloarchaea archaeon]